MWSTCQGRDYLFGAGGAVIRPAASAGPAEKQSDGQATKADPAGAAAGLAVEAQPTGRGAVAARLAARRRSARAGGGAVLRRVAAAEQASGGAARRCGRSGGPSLRCWLKPACPSRCTSSLPSPRAPRHELTHPSLRFMFCRDRLPTPRLRPCHRARVMAAAVQGQV